MVNIQYTPENQAKIRVYIVPDNTMSASAVIGRDTLEKCNVTLTALPVEKKGILSLRF